MPDLPDSDQPLNKPLSEEKSVSEISPAEAGSPPEETSSPGTSPPWQTTAVPQAGAVPKTEAVPEPLVSPPLTEPSPTPARPVSPPSAESAAPVSPVSEKTEVFRAKKGSPAKILGILLLLLIIAGLGWAGYRFVLPRLSKPKEITLTYWGLWESEAVMKEVINEWETKNPQIKVRYSQQSPQEYRERVQSALARDDGPDIFRFHNTWLPMFENELEPVPATVMDAATYEQTFYPVAASTLRFGAGYLGVPLEIDTLALFYNQDILTTAGVSPPQTWDELRQLASQLTLRDEEGRIQRAGVALGTTTNIWHWSDILGLMMLQNGADLTNPTGSLAEDTLTFYTLFNKTDRVWDETLPASLLAFATGKTAMFFGYSWDVFEIQSINPNLNFKIIPVPQLPGTDISWASFWVEGVAKKSENKEAAWEFLKFLSSKETLQKLYQAESKVRLFGEPYSRVGMASTLKADPIAAPFIEQAPKAQSWYLCSRTFDNGINDRMIKYFEDAVNAVNGGESVDKALSTAASGVAQILSQYGLGSYTAR